VPRAGLTGSHRQFLEATDTVAVVVVIAGNEKGKCEKFAREARGIAGEHCPMVLVSVDGDRNCGFGTVVSCVGYKAETLWEVAHSIFGV
jgi:hypothetical protein